MLLRAVVSTIRTMVNESICKTNKLKVLEITVENANKTILHKSRKFP